MPTYTPPDQPEVTVKYTILPGQKGNRNQPEFLPELEIEDILIHGQEVSYDIFGCLFERFQWEWEEGIMKDNVRCENYLEKNEG